MTRQALGREAERRAEAFLREKGMEILARNWRIREAEIDLIARDGAYLVFVEVKARSSAAYGQPRVAVNARKRRRIALAAACYLQEQNCADAFARFDVVEVLNGRIAHWPNAFDAQG